MCPERESDSNGPPAPELGATILVVEDDVMIRIGISDFLRQHGYHVAEAASADEARLIFRIGWPVDAVFSDVNLPELFDGIELALWLQLNQPGLPVVLTSAYDGAVRTAALSCENVCEFLPKPYDFSKVESLLRGLIERPSF